jgi:hypothetical protein
MTVEQDGAIGVSIRAGISLAFCLAPSFIGVETEALVF